MNEKTVPLLAFHHMLSVIMAFVMVLTSIFGSYVPVSAASSVKAVRLKGDDVKKDIKAIPDASSYSGIQFPSNTSGISIDVKDGMTEAPHGDDKYWIWKDRDQGDNAGGMGDAYIHSLSEGGSYWIKYKNVGLADQAGNGTGTYDIKVTFDNATGKIDGAEGHDIALFTGQMGAVRFRGYKSIDCTIDIYKHGTNERISNDAKLGLRFMDIDCHQGLTVLTEGRVEHSILGYKGKDAKLKWGCPSASDANKDNSVWYDGSKDAKDNMAQGQNHPALKYALRVLFHPSGDATFRVRYYAGGRSKIGTQTNGAFFSFDGYLGLTSPKIFEASVDKDVNGAEQYQISSLGDTFTYHIPIDIDEESEKGKSLVMTDTFDNGINPTGEFNITDSNGSVLYGYQGGQIVGNGSFSGGFSGKTLKLSATSAFLAGNPTGTYTVNVPATVNADRGALDPHWDAPNHRWVIPNSAKINYSGGDPVDSGEDPSNEVYVIVPTTTAQINKWVEPFEYKVGDHITWHIDVTNTGGTNLFGTAQHPITISDGFPWGFYSNEFSVSGEGASHDNNVVNGSLPRDLGPGQTWSIVVNTIAQENAGDNSGNGLFGSGKWDRDDKENYNVALANAFNIFDTIPVSDDAEEYTNTAQLHINKTVDKYEHKVGDKVNFTIVVKNVGKHGTVANNVRVSDNIPANMQLVPGSVKCDFSSQTVNYPVAGTGDPANVLNPELRGEKTPIQSQFTPGESGNGFNATINKLASGTWATITYTAIAQKSGNGVESKNDAYASADNAVQVADDAEYYINSAHLHTNKTIKKITGDPETGDYEYEIGDTAEFTVTLKNDETDGNNGTVANNPVIQDAIPSSMKLDPKSLSVVSTVNDFAHHYAGTNDPENELNGSGKDERNYTNEMETKHVNAKVAAEGNGFKMTADYLPAGQTITVKFRATATRDGNGKEMRNIATSTCGNNRGDNNNGGKPEVSEDDVEYYINTADLAIHKQYVNPYKAQKNDNRYDNEFRVHEGRKAVKQYDGDWDSAYDFNEPDESVHYKVDVTSSGDDGTVARHVTINDLKLPVKDGENLLKLNYDQIRITETTADGKTKTFTPAGGNGQNFKYRIAGTEDPQNQRNDNLINETRDEHGVVTLTQQGNGWKLDDTYLPKGWKLTIEYTADASEKINGDRVVNTAYTTCRNMVKDNFPNIPNDKAKYVTRSDKAEVYINSPRLHLEKKVDSKRYEVGDPITYTITAKNNTRGTIARNVLFTDILAPYDLKNEIPSSGVKLQKTTIALIDQNGDVLEKNEVTYGDGGKLQDSNKTATGAKGNYVTEINNNHFTMTTSRFLINAANHRLWDLALGGDYSPKTLNNWNPAKNTPAGVYSAGMLSKLTAPYTGNSMFPNGDIRKDTSLQIEYQMVITDKELAGKLINNRARVTSDEKIPVWTEEGVTPNPPTLKITKKADKDKYNYALKEDRNPEYVVNIDQTRAAVIAHNVVIHDAFTEKDIKIKQDTLKVFFNDKDVTRQMKKITFSKDLTGYDIETGMDQGDSDHFRVEYQTELQESSVGKSLNNTARAVADNAAEVSATETITVVDVPPELVITKSSDKDKYYVGEIANYTVKVKNNADNSLARNVVIWDELEDKGEKIVKDSIKIQDENKKDFTKDCDIKATDLSYRIDTHRNMALNDEFTVTYQVDLSNRELEDQYVTNVANAQGDNVGKVTDDNKIYVYPPNTIGGKTSNKVQYSFGEIGHYTTYMQVTNDAKALHVQLHDELKNEGARILPDTVKVVDWNGKDITKDMKSKKIQNYQMDIDTGLDMEKGQKLTVTYGVIYDNPTFINTQVPNEVQYFGDNFSWTSDNRTHIYPDFKLHKTSDPAPDSSVKTGDKITYFLTVENTKDLAEKNVMIKDTVPDYTKFVSAEDGGKMQKINDREVVVFNIPELKVGEKKTVKFTVEVTADGDTQKTVENLFYAKVLGKDEDTSDLFSHLNDEDFKKSNIVRHFLDHTVDVFKPELKIEKTSDKKVYSVDDIGHYQAVVTQTQENATAEKVVIKDSLHNEGATIVDDTIKLYDDKDDPVKGAKIELNKDKTGYTIETGQDLAYNKTLTVKYDVKFTRDAASEPQIRNVAKTTAKNFGTPDPKDPSKLVPTWVEDDNIVTVIAPTLTIEKASDKDEYEVGETGEYTVKVTQPVKNATAKDVVIKDEFQKDGVKIDKDSIKVYDKDGKELTIDKIKKDDKSYQIDTGRDLAYNEFFTVKYKVLFESQTLANQTVLNKAKAKGSNTIITTTEKTITPVKVDDGLTAVKSSVPATGTQVVQGQKITYHIAVTNVGGKARENVLVLDAVPEKSTYVEDSAQINVAAKDGSVTSAGNGEVVTIDGKQYVSWTIPKIEAGQSGVVSFAVRVNADAKEDDIIKNVALVAPSDTHKDLDPDKPETWKPDEFVPTNETDHPLDPWVETTHEVKVIAPDIIIEKSSDKETYKTGETAHYTVKVGNDVEGTEAENVEIRDSFQIEGMEIQKDSIKITDPEGKDITKAVDITMTNEKGDNSGYQIVTKRNLKTGQFFTVTYDAVIRDENLAGKEVENIAMAKADNATAKTTNKVTPKDIGGGIRAAKTSDPISGTQVKGGDTITYNITLLNDADEVNDHVYLMDQIPDLTGYVEGSAKVLRLEAENIVTPVTSETTTTETSDVDLNVTSDEGTKSDDAATEAAAETASTEKAAEATTAAESTADSKDKTSFTDIINAMIGKVTGKETTDTAEDSTKESTEETKTSTPVIDTSIVRDPSILGESLVETGEKAEIKDVSGKKYVTTKISIPANGRRIVQFKVTVNKDVDDHSVIKNVALVNNTDNPGEDPWDPNGYTPTNETDHPTGPWVPTDHTITPKDGVPNLTIQKKSDKAVYNVGETGHYTVVVGQEKEGVTAKNVVIKDAFQRTGMTINKDSIKIADPFGKDITKAVHITTGESSYQIDTGMDLKYKETFTVTYDVTFNDASLAGQQVVNVAKAKADNAHAQTNNTVTPVTIADNLTALKTSEPASGMTVKQGDQITYHIAVSNTGTVNKEHVYVMDEVPAKTTYVDGSAGFSLKDNDKEGVSETPETAAKADGTGSVQQVDGKTYVCFEIGQVAAGKTVDAQFAVTVNKDATEDDVITNVALARSKENVPENPWNPSEYTPTNTTTHLLSNWVTTTHTVTLQNPETPALGIEKTSDKTEYKAGETGHYTVTVTGKQGETKNVVISDSLQKDLGATIVDNSIQVHKKSVTVKGPETAWDSATQKAAETASTETVPATATTEVAATATTEATVTTENTADVTQNVKVDSTKTGYTVTTNDSLKQGEQFIVTYDVKFTKASAGSDIKNAASAYGDGVTPVNTDNKVTVHGLKPKLKVTKKSEKKTYKKGQTGKYTVTITNTEKGTTAKNVVIKDVFNNKRVSIDKSSIKIKDQNGKKIPLHWSKTKKTWYGFTYSLKKTKKSDDYSPDLDYGKEIVITYKVKFNKASLVGKKLTNTATADADNAKKAKAKNTVTIKKASPKKTSGKENPSRRNGGSSNPGGSGSSSGGNGGGNGLKGVQTGIESHEALFAAIAAMLLSGALALKIRSRRKKKESSDEKF